MNNESYKQKFMDKCIERGPTLTRKMLEEGKFGTYKKKWAEEYLTECMNKLLHLDELTNGYVFGSNPFKKSSPRPIGQFIPVGEFIPLQIEPKPSFFKRVAQWLRLTR